MKFAGFSGTQRGRIKQYRKSGKMVGGCFHTDSVWGESTAGMAARTGCKEMMFTFLRHPVLGIMAAMSFGPSVVPQGDGYMWSEDPAHYYSKVINFESVAIADIPAGLVAWIRENY